MTQEPSGNPYASPKSPTATPPPRRTVRRWALWLIGLGSGGILASAVFGVWMFSSPSRSMASSDELLRPVDVAADVVLSVRYVYMAIVAAATAACVLMAGVIGWFRR